MVLRATLQTGEQFVVDFTHNQWGWRECLYDWATFVELRTSSVIDIAPVGQWCSVTCQARNIALEPKSYDFGMAMLRKEIMKSVVRKTSELISSHGTWECLVRLRHHYFADVCDDIVDAIKQTIEETQAMHVNRGLGRIYFEETEHFWKQARDDLWRTASWRHSVTISPYGTAQYKDVWLLGDEYAEVQGNVDALKRLWAEKMRKVALAVHFKTSISMGSRSLV